MAKNICIIGGCGHVGLPLGIALASKDHNVTLLDINQMVVSQINDGIVPFKEDGAEPLLKKHIGNNLIATTDANIVGQCDTVFFVTGTPVDEHLNPRVNDVLKVIRSYLPQLNKNQLIILRSTLYPGVTELIDNMLTTEIGQCNLAFCPERIVQGKGVEEIFTLPQIVSATSKNALAQSIELFKTVTKDVIVLETIEAELAKLITNSWRYLEFAIANQFYMMIESKGLSFYKIFNALKENYPRASHYVKPGLAAGPCLFKDTMQLSAFHNSNFTLGEAARKANEGLPNFLVEQLEQKIGSLKNKKIAILGMTFKANNDDIRESLSFKIKKILEIKMAFPLPSDPYLPNTRSLNDALETADAVILGIPHNEYLNLKIDKPFIDCWGIWDTTK